MSSVNRADYAEWLPRLHPDEVIEPGDIVGIFAGKVTKITADAHCVMAISTNPAILGKLPDGGDTTLYEKVTFLGQIAVKVRGTVQIGDYILPSGLNDGVGIAVSPQNLSADNYAIVLGRAWDSSEDGELKQIKVIVGVHSSYPQVSDLTTNIQTQQSEIEALKAELKNLKRLFAV